MPVRSRSPGPNVRRPPGSSSRPPTSPSARWPSGPASGACASSTTPCAPCSRPPRPRSGRLARRRRRASEPGAITLRLARREPFAGADLLAFLGVAHGAGRRGGRRQHLRAHPRPAGRTGDDAPHRGRPPRRGDAPPAATCATSSRPSPRPGGCSTSTRIPAAVDEHLEQDPDLGPLVRKTPGRRLPGAVAGHELAVRAVIGQQVSVAGARTVAGRLVRSLGRPLPEPVGGLTHLFPTAERAGRRGSRGSPDAAVAWPGPDRRWPPPSPPARSSSTPGRTATAPVRNCWPDPASARGPPTTS